MMLIVSLSYQFITVSISPPRLAGTELDSLIRDHAVTADLFED